MGLHRDLTELPGRDVSIATLTLADLSIEGASRAGDETWFRIRPPGVGFDVGRGSERLAGAAQIFLTHGHLDHALGLPYLLSQRGQRDGDPVAIHGPAAACESIGRFIDAAARMEGTRLQYTMRPMEPGQRCVVGRGLTIEAFRTDHLLPSLGFHLLRRRKRLKDRYRPLSGAELGRLRAEGVTIEDHTEELWLSYCGDTGPGVFDLEPRLFGAKVLLLECTFFDEKAVERARSFKHMHLQDLVARSSEFGNEDLVLHHMSRRYTCRQMLDRVGEELTLVDTRVHLFGC